MTFKLLAVLFMIIDHIGVYFGYALPEPIYIAFRVIGRMAYPMFAYLLVVNLRRTSNILRYIARLAIVGIATQILFFLIGLYTEALTFVNIFISFVLGIMFLLGIELMWRAVLTPVPGFRESLARFWRTLTGVQSEYALAFRGRPPHTNDPVPARPLGAHAEKTFVRRAIWPPALFAGRQPGLAFLTGFGLFFAGLLLTYLPRPDFDFYNLLVMPVFYALHLGTAYPDNATPYRQQRIRWITFFLAFVLINLAFTFLTVLLDMDWTYRMIQNTSIFAVFFFPLEQNSKPSRSKAGKAFFYLFYPVHLVILMLLSEFMRGRL